MTILYLVKTALSSFFMFSIPFSLVCILLFCDLVKGVCLGIGGGLLFSIGITFFSYDLAKKAKEWKKVLEGSVKFDCAANHLNEKEAVGGWIFLVNEEVYFISHKCNYNCQKLEIQRSNIREIKKGKLPGAICLRLKNGEEECFIVSKRNEFIDKIWDMKEN